LKTSTGGDGGRPVRGWGAGAKKAGPVGGKAAPRRLHYTTRGGRDAEYRNDGEKGSKEKLAEGGEVNVCKGTLRGQHRNCHMATATF